MKKVVSNEKVAFIAHPVDLDIFRSYIAALKPEKKYSDELLVKLFEWVPPYSVKLFPGLSLDGCHFVYAEMFMVPFLPEMHIISVVKIITNIDTALALAEKRRCTIAAVGGF